MTNASRGRPDSSDLWTIFLHPTYLAIIRRYEASQRNQFERERERELAEKSGINVGVVTSSGDGGDHVHIGEEEEEEEEALKKMISGHPLYELLVENHTNCLKVCMGERSDGIGTTTRSSCSVSEDNANIKKALANPSSTDLDQFMEAYCNALNKLKERMEDPLKETSSFINFVHAQIEELTGDSNKINQTEPN